MGTGKPPVLLKTQPAFSKVSGILANTTGDWLGKDSPQPSSCLPVTGHCFSPRELDILCNHPKVQRGVPTLDEAPGRQRSALKSPEPSLKQHGCPPLVTWKDCGPQDPGRQHFPGLVFISTFTLPSSLCLFSLGLILLSTVQLLKTTFFFLF